MTNTSELYQKFIGLFTNLFSKISFTSLWKWFKPILDSMGWFKFVFWLIMICLLFNFLVFFSFIIEGLYYFLKYFFGFPVSQILKAFKTIFNFFKLRANNIKTKKVSVAVSTKDTAKENLSLRLQLGKLKKKLAQRESGKKK
ncbi:hypothetical protein AXA84_0454 [Candidatus Phytoplasma oryzae]|uniref:Uncharacterized protein n=1 Tax=Candidatus Phytoplasma oryzae TaxID=203274 RepID=A0A139JQ96_9MOLU|nr:hypothetical protein [Candidatus Phytoplasma oryzae]KXT29040.1 hypothetical protein AXA84_0454 [Candidatus Phytoplasma oryzae]